jgi:predicted unusual protein kinase regulating ubiquinone biosynthesis (AarF/ABC1/UbiB family)
MLRSRYFRILIFFARLLLAIFAWDLIMPRLGLRSWSQRTRSKRLTAYASRFRSLAIQMGGVMIKVGQFLSARVDVLPSEVTQELSGLQDEVPAEEFSDIRRVVESEFGIPLQEKFTHFSENPDAAASLGQVHSARLEDRIVVVKVQRPGIEQIIATDLAALRTVANWLQRYRPISRRVNLPALMEEFTRILYEEIDYLAEGKNAETFAHNFANRPGVRVPQVVWSHTTKRVLTLEDVRGIKISDYTAISVAGIDRSSVAERLFNTYLQQIFEDNFYHADPHPGNLFITPLDSGSPDESGVGKVSWLLTFVDFGMVGQVPENLRAGMREMVIALGTRDAPRLVKSFQMMGVLLPEADLALLEKAEAMMFDRFWGKSMSELANISPAEMREFSGQFRELIYTLPFQVPENIILLGRTFGILSGMCTGLDPDFNIWENTAPFAERLVSEEASSSWRVWLGEAGRLAQVLFFLPTRLNALVDRVEHGELTVRDPQLEQQVWRLERSFERLIFVLIFAVLLLGGIQLLLGGQSVLGRILMGTAGLLLAGLLLSILFRR